MEDSDSNLRPELYDEYRVPTAESTVVVLTPRLS